MPNIKLSNQIKFYGGSTISATSMSASAFSNTDEGYKYREAASAAHENTFPANKGILYYGGGREFSDLPNAPTPAFLSYGEVFNYSHALIVEVSSDDNLAHAKLLPYVVFAENNKTGSLTNQVIRPLIGAVALVSAIAASALSGSQSRVIHNPNSSVPADLRPFDREGATEQASHHIGQDGRCIDLRKLFEVEDCLALREYVGEHPFLQNLLIEAHSKIGKIFGSETQVTLRLFTDPYSQDVQLFAVILTSLEPEKVWTLQTQLDEEWWFDNIERAQGKLALDVGYI